MEGSATDGATISCLLLIGANKIISVIFMVIVLINMINTFIVGYNYFRITITLTTTIWKLYVICYLSGFVDPSQIFKQVVIFLSSLHVRQSTFTPSTVSPKYFKTLYIVFLGITVLASF